MAPEVTTQSADKLNDAAQELTPQQVAAMRSAGLFFLLMAMATLGTEIATSITRGMQAPVKITGPDLVDVLLTSPSVAILDCIMSGQLWRLHIKWRPWAVGRAAISVILGITVVVAWVGVDANANQIKPLIGLSQIVYGGSLWLLLVGRPGPARVLAGRILFATGLTIFMAVVTGAL